MLANKILMGALRRSGSGVKHHLEDAGQHLKRMMLRTGLSAGAVSHQGVGDGPLQFSLPDLLEVERCTPGRRNCLPHNGRPFSGGCEPCP